jgi:hypothetical protein
MTFIHGYVLGGLALIGLPVLIHLIMRQKPKILQFPAFRFLRQRHRINQRKIRLRHLLLLALRMALIAALCLALARPRIVSGNLPFGGERPVAAVLVFDTSPSMEYAAGGKTRLEEAKQRARELLAEMAPDSQVAVFDTGDELGSDDPGEAWVASALLDSRIESLAIRPANAPLNRQINRAYRLLQKVGDQEDAPPRFLYVFSDRTRGCWDANEAKKTPPHEGVNTVFVDVGVDDPQDLAIDEVKVVPPVAAPGSRVQIQVRVRSFGDKHDNKISLRIEPEADPARPPDEEHVALAKGEGRVYVFERDLPAKSTGTAEVPHQVTVKLGGSDALPGNNVRYATFLVRDKRKVLTLVQQEREARFWRAALNTVSPFQCDVRKADAELTARDLAPYKVVCLFEVAKPSADLWKTLREFVRTGGGLVIVPGGDEIDREAYNGLGVEEGLMPATFESLVPTPANKPIGWTSFSGPHPLMAQFQSWSRTAGVNFEHPDVKPLANRYWRVKPVENATEIATYADERNPPDPVLVERLVGEGEGKVVLFTTALDDRLVDRNRPWHNYFTSWFGPVLINEVCRYLAGDVAVPENNFFCGQPVAVLLPTPPPASPFILLGPGLTQAETNVSTEEGQTRLAVPQAVAPGNFTVQSKGQTVAGFSLNVRPEESDLERVPVEDVEAALGKDSVLPVGRTASLRDALQGHWAPPLELLPTLMILVLLGLAVESLLANKFYRRTAPAPEPVRNPS